MAKIDDIKNKQGETIYPRTLTRAVYEEGTNKKLSTKIAEYDAHVADNTAIKHKAREIQLINSKFTSTNVEDGMKELFTNVSDGKSLVGGAITDVDDSVVIPTDPTFGDLASAVGQISTGKKWASGTAKVSDGGFEVKNLTFIPTIVVFYYYISENDYGGGLYADNFKTVYNIMGATSFYSSKGVVVGWLYKTDNGFKTVSLHPIEDEDVTWVAFE